MLKKRARVRTGFTVTLIMMAMLLALLAYAGQNRTLAQGPTGNATPAAGGPGNPPPGGNPPAGGPGNPPPGNGGGDSSPDTGLASATGAYTLDGGTATQDGQTYTASGADQSGVYVKNGGALTLTKVTITTSGDTSSQDYSSFYGLNAGLLAAYGSTVTLSDSAVTTSGAGANGVFATGSGSSATLTKVTINATGEGGHGVMATLGGVLTLDDVTMNTTGTHSAAYATDRGGGTITATGGTVTTSGQDSPGIYSTGSITVSGATITATGAESAVIEGANSITLNNTALSSSKDDKWGVMIYQSMSGDAQGTEGTFTMTGGSLANTAAHGPLFYVTNSTGVISLSGVDVTAASGVLVNASAGNWGSSGANGGTVILTADKQTLAGDMTADALSAMTVTLQDGSTLTGAINTDQSAKEIHLTLDATSTWTVTADSYLATLADSGGISGSSVTNIVGNGHNVYYDASAAANSALGGQTYALANGGELLPKPG